MPKATGRHGPRTLTKFRQVCVPIALLREVGLASGDDVYFELSPDGRSILITPTSASAAAKNETP